MNPEERKAIAMQHHLGCSRYDGDAERHYPKCCAYHTGFDDSLALLKFVGFRGYAGGKSHRTYVVASAP